MIVDAVYTESILKWCLSESNRKQYMLEKPYHTAGDPIGITHLEQGHDSFPVEDLLKLSQLLLENYGLAPETEIEDSLGFLVGYSEEGHEVHVHRDQNKDDKIHTRINILISKPEEGGNPIISGIEIPVEQNQPWLCVAGQYWHSTSKTKGLTPRIILSLGYYIPRKTVEVKGWI